MIVHLARTLKKLYILRKLFKLPLNIFPQLQGKFLKENFGVNSEAATGGGLKQKVFLEISQN